MFSLCPQTYIFTDGEDEELKKKIGTFDNEGDFIWGTKKSLFYFCFIFLKKDEKNHIPKNIKNSFMTPLPPGLSSKKRLY